MEPGELQHVGGCQNYGPFLGTLKIRCRIMLGIQKGTIILTTTHVLHVCNRHNGGFPKMRLRPDNKDYTSVGGLLGSPCLRKLPTIHLVSLESQPLKFVCYTPCSSQAAAKLYEKNKAGGGMCCYSSKSNNAEYGFRV